MIEKDYKISEVTGRMATITEKEPKSILTKTGGYLAGYSHSLNTYKGCVFGCSYCYVRKLPVNLFHKGEWGSWVEVKKGVREVLEKEMRREKKKGPVTVFMSSSTDPYQPIEHRAKVTREVLEVFSEPEFRPDFLLVQTRSPLVTRDLDLFQKLKGTLRVSMTVETDRDDVRKRFAMGSPPIPARLKALKALSDSGIPTQAAVAPLLPSTPDFPFLLKKSTSRICLDDFRGDGSEGRRTELLGIQTLYTEEEKDVWYSSQALDRMYERFLTVFGKEHVKTSQEGFAPF